ncbi:hypothetical protein B9479_005740 [Cryptococcus floricola]|uniref:Uncharacterized protein n=1 Tax=Cryptococcus floricola TaxID=2591691 RepID=A0A5D3AS50_9TREE|nr:hypothetical protein B9479_005740 [Cryptococcus floricola]
MFTPQPLPLIITAHSPPIATSGGLSLSSTFSTLQSLLVASTTINVTTVYEGD